MRKVYLVLLACVAIYSLGARSAFTQSESAPEANGEQVEQKVSRDPTLQAPWDDCVSKDAQWHLIYPGTTAFYVGGTIQDMHMYKDSALRKPWVVTGVRQLQRKGRVALTSGCLLFAFKATNKDSFNPNEFENKNFGIRACSNDISFSENKPAEATCARVDTYNPIKSYVMMIPYAKVDLLSRGKYATSDFAAISTVYIAGVGAILAGIYNSIKDQTAAISAVSGAAAVMGLYYYFFVARPRLQQNYVGVFVEPAVPRITLTRKDNSVTASTALPHYFRVGQQIEISGVANSDLVGISTISRDVNGTVRVKTKNEHGLSVGAQIMIADVDDPSFNGQFQVASVPADSSMTFTYEQKDKSKAATSAGGRVQDVWNGTFVVESIDSRSFTYWQPGPNENSTLRTGTAGVVTPVNTNLAVSGNLALDKTATANFKSIDLTGTGTIAPPPAKSDELFKKGDLLMFRIPDSHDYWNISMTLSGGTGLTFVSETAEKAGK